ncbi:MAG: MBL fold metallo-hydrolase [Ignavibacteria bacterium]|nr:MBL fold metallo-hydrolase [Ignavibacteria bacterium]
MHIQFHGAARTVTGSMHLLQVGDQNILLDCGIYHGRREEARKRNRELPFEASQIDAVVLSHAHIDHSGNLPGLVRQGFSGPIFATHATKSLCHVMLMDSAYIQQRDAEYLNKRKKRKGLPLIEPLYTEEDVRSTSSLMTGVDYGRTIDIVAGIEARFVDAGHILGSASVLLTLREGGETIRLAFTGDLGRPNLPILRDPVFVGGDEGADYVISESTYGGRFHAPVERMRDQLLDPIRRTCERKGKIIIPAFSVGRTQEIVYVLHKLSTEGLIGHLPVFVDSPLSVNVTDVFRKHPECYDEQARAILNAPENNDPFGFETLTYIRNVEESKALNEREGPFVVISASGMCEAGRVVHHLSNSVEDPANMIIIPGYQAEHTLGKKLVVGEEVVNILGEPRSVMAEITVLNSFSGHADRNELLAYLGKFDRRQVRNTFLVHGDEDQCGKLADGLHEQGFSRTLIPARGEKVPLN